MKDPAFLFYSKDFYESTRTLLPEERACYIDLLIYQHQNGSIPKNIKRVLQYCSGIDEATLQATLQAKFKDTSKGWINERLHIVLEDRKSYAKKQSNNGKIGQFFKKAKAMCSSQEYQEIKDLVYNQWGKDLFIEKINQEGTTLEGLLKASLKHIVNVNVNVNVNEDNNKKGVEKIDFDSDELTVDHFELEFTKWIKSKNQDFYFHNDHRKEYDQIFEKTRNIILGRGGVVSLQSIIQSIEFIYQSAGWHKEKMLSPKYFSNNFDSIIIATKNNKNSIDKFQKEEMLKEIDQQIEEAWK